MGRSLSFNAQLIDALSGEHLWAERFDRSLENTFAVQDEATAKIVKALLSRLRRDETYRTRSRRFLAASLAQLGRLDEARTEVALFLVGNPHFSTQRWVDTEPFRDGATLEHFVDGFRKAGLPE